MTAVTTGESPYLTRLRAGGMSDADFDAIFPARDRAVSDCYWTPLFVAARAAQLLVEDTSTRVLDIGAGVGKFCIAGAAVTGAQFVGVEHREHLVETARAVAAQVGVTTVSFVHAPFETMDISSFDAVYLFNPFEENVWPRCQRIDSAVDLSRERFLEDVGRTERLLARARVGTRVVTYHGFGGEMPPVYHLALQDERYSGPLELWIRG